MFVDRAGAMNGLAFRKSVGAAPAANLAAIDLQCAGCGRLRKTTPHLLPDLLVARLAAVASLLLGRGCTGERVRSAVARFDGRF